MFLPALKKPRSSIAVTPWPQPTRKITEAVPQTRPKSVSSERSRCAQSRRIAWRTASNQQHTLARRMSSRSMRPSRIEMRRWVCAPIAGSCVTITTVLPSTWTERSSARISLAGLRVEVAGRLVREHEARAVHERARDRDALALAARELRRQVPRASREADALERRERALAPLARAETPR